MCTGVLMGAVCCRGALVLLTKATAEEWAVSSRRSRGKEGLEGSLSLVPLPFEDSVLVPLHSAVQQDVLQVHSPCFRTVGLHVHVSVHMRCVFWSAQFQIENECDREYVCRRL